MMENRWLKIDDHNIHYVEMGNNFPLLLLHGGSNDWHEWEKNIVALAHCYRVIAPDMVGFGNSDRKKGVYSIDDFVHFLSHFVSALNINHMHMIGHSLGGRIALEFAYRYPNKVAKLIPVAPYGLGSLSFWGYVLAITFYWGRKLFFRKQPFPTLDLDDSRNGVDEFISKLKKVEAPVMIIWGKRDLYVPVKQAYIANGAFPNSRLVVIPRCGHAPQREYCDFFNKQALDFLSGDTDCYIDS